MSETDKPRINVTRGKKRRTRKRRSSDSSTSGGLLPGPMEVASGLVRGARTLWWAGLGALSVAREAGATMFDALVEEGKSWEQAQRERTEKTARQVEELSKKGARTVETVEKQVRGEVHEALHRLGVPHRDDVDALRDQIDVLAGRVDRLADTIAEETRDGKTE
jgi:poly(hydroxyalkanoate) granule-associated protein